MRITLIAALDEDGVIGRGGDLPWRLPADLAHFKRATMGRSVIVGRRTYDTIGKPLPGRTLIVVTRQPGFAAPGCAVATDVEHALQLASATGGDEVLVAGGAQIYAQLLPRADRLLLTRVHARVAGEVRFPDFDAAAWREVERVERPADAKNPHDLSFVTLERAAG